MTKTVYVIVAGYEDGSISSIDVLGVFDREDDAKMMVEIIDKADPCKTLVIRAAPMEA